MNNEIVNFIDENVLRKANSIEQFRQGLDTVRNYLSLKGPLDDNTNQYLISLNECAQELISIRKKGFTITTDAFFPEKKDVELDEPTHGPTRAHHYSDPC